MGHSCRHPRAADPQAPPGHYFPSLLEPRRRHERALLSVVQEAYIHGVSTRAVDNLAEALGIKSISKDQVSRICEELDAQVHAFRTRRLDSEFPYLFLDATFEKVRENGRVISMAVMIAVGVRSTGEREVVGVDVGPAEDHEFWLQFLRQLVSRGLSDVRLVISDSHLGLKQAVASWQRCRVPLHAQRPGHGAQGRSADGGRDAAYLLRAARPGKRARDHRAHLPALREALPAAGQGRAGG